MLAISFRCLLEPEGPYAANLVRAERVNHEGVGVTPEVFERFLPLVRDCCAEALGADWTPDMAQSWDAAIGRLLG
jgi:hypothetical protein